MAAALKDIRAVNNLLPGLYPGWKVTQDFTSDMLWIEGPQGYVARIPRKALDDAGCGLDGVLEFILQKDARIKREASLQVPLYEQVRRKVERELEAEMCAKGGSATPVAPAVMAAREDYLRYMDLRREAQVQMQLPVATREQTREGMLKVAELAGMSRGEIEVMLYPPIGASAGVEMEPADFQDLPDKVSEQGRFNKPRAPVHKPWNGVREVDLD